MEHRPGTLETIAKRLDIERKAVKNWRHFSWELDVDSSVIEPLKWYGNFSPTIRVFEHLEVVKPDLTVLEVKKALVDIGRQDLKDRLDEAKSNFVNVSFCITHLIDHLHYDVKAQRLLVVVVKFAGKHHLWLMIG